MLYSSFFKWVIAAVSGLFAVVGACQLCLASNLDAARTLHRDGQFEQALALYRQLIDDPIQTLADRATAANNACVILLNSGLYPEALDSCLTARSLRLTLDDPQRLARTLNNLAAVLEASGQYQRATDSYMEALEINERLNDWESVAINYANLGVLATQTGHYGPALSFYDRVENLATLHGSEAWAPVQMRFATINRGVVLERIGAFREALGVFRSIDTTSMTSDSLATLKINTGVAYRNLGDPIRALREFDLAAELISVDDQVAISNLWLDRALVQHLNLHDLDAAEIAYQTALTLADSAGASSEKLMALYYLARLQSDRGQFDQSQASFQQVLNLAVDTGALEGQWSALEGLARIKLHKGHAAEAYTHLTAAMTIIESTRAGLDEGRLRLEFFGSQRSVYALAIEAAWQLLAESGDSAYSEAGFQISQRAKARELLTSLTSSELVPLEELRPEPGEILLEYFFADENLYLWTLSDRGLTVHQLGVAGEIRGTLDHAYNELQRQGRSGRLTELSLILIKPVAASLIDYQRVRIAPDGLLFHLPFELLASNGEMLLDKHIVTYTPSASVNSVTARRSMDTRHWLFAGFGAIDVTANASAVRYALPALPGARQELLALDRQLPGPHVLALGSEATEARFFEVLSESVAIAHVATHTVFDDRLGSAIVLSPDSLSDGLLFPTEIVKKSINIDLTVLAACSSAIGGVEDGRAISSLTGALLSAGSSAVLAALWDVDDSYTQYFMQQFYHELARGMAPAAALRKTKLTLRDAGKTDSTSWAAFVLVGDTGPMVKRSLDYRFVLGASLLFFGWWMLRRQIRK